MEIDNNALPIATQSPDERNAPKSKSMSVWDGFIYNFLAMGVIFPWVYIWGPAAFPGANLYGALLLVFVVQVPISLAYSFLASRMPVDAGDYVYQTRAFGSLGSIIVMGGFVVCILQWLGIAGWLFATLGLAPLFLSVGYFLHSLVLTQLGIICESRGGVFVIALILNFFTVRFLIGGLPRFAKVQRWLFVMTLAAIGAMVYVFMQPGSTERLNDFVQWLADQLHRDMPLKSASGLAGLIIRDASSYHYNVNPTPSVWSTLGIVPLAWISLQWATYSVEQNSEIQGADRLKNQVIMLLGSAAAVTGVLLLIAFSEQSALGKQFLGASAGVYWFKNSASPEMLLFTTRILQPFPNVFAIAVSGNLLASIIIGAGFLANAFQIACNSFIGIGKILVAMSRDGVLPRAWRLDEIDTTHRSPARAYWAYLIAGLPVIAGYSLLPKWGDYTLGGITFGCGCVFMITAFAATRILDSRFQKAVGFLASILAALMVGAYAFVPQLGLQGIIPFFVALGIIFVCVLVRFRSRLSIRRSGAEECSNDSDSAERAGLPL